VSVIAPWAEQTTAGLSRFLGELWGTDVGVALDSVASTGARRRNVLFTATADGLRHPLVATIVPTAALQIQDFLIEPAAIQLAEGHGVPVPHVIGATTDESYVAGPFFVSTRIDGETVPRRVLRLIESNDLGQRMARQSGEALAALHRIPVAEVPAGLEIETGDPCAQALVRLETVMETLLQPSAALSLGVRWLQLHLPSTRCELAVVHSDFRIGNVIVGDDGLRAVLDWEIVRTGDAMEDTAWPTVRMWRFGNDELEVGGFADTVTFRDAYTAAGGAWDEERFRWWQICGTLRWGTGLAGQARAHLDGSVPSVVMAASGRRIAEQEYDMLSLIRRRLEVAG
jgi:aminoglycoside phosphotransferase (APT) family kinase protein